MSFPVSVIIIYIREPLYGKLLSESLFLFTLPLREVAGVSSYLTRWGWGYVGHLKGFWIYT